MLHPNITREEARAELARILNSGKFSKGLSRLLDHLVMGELNGGRLGRADLEAKFGTDLAVKLTRLRRKLRDYYSGSGRADRVRITVAKRGHEVVIELSGVAAQSARRASEVEVRFDLFSRFQGAMCWERNLDQRARDEAVRKWFKTEASARVKQFLRALPQPWRSPVTDFDQITYDDFLKRLSNTSIRFSEMRSLIDMFEFDPLLLDPLLSEEQDRPDYLTLNLQKDFIEVGDGSDSYGKGATYSLPAKRLKGTDAALVQLELDQGGHSKIHAHPGDEAMLLLSGQVQVRFERSGIRTVLNPGDYVHFYAEMPHSAWNLADKSRLLIIRFYQMDLQDTRQLIRREAERALREHELGLKARHYRLSPLTERWLLQAITRPSPTEDDEIQDKIGLARLLSVLRKAQGLTLDVISGRSGFTEARLEKLEEARDGIKRAELESLARGYAVDEMLFHNFFFDGVTGAVVVRRCSTHDASGSVARSRESVEDDDMEKIDSPRLPRGVSYRVPCRNLAFSDIAITKLTLDQNCATPWNWHPGCELLIPLWGSARVEYKVGSEESVACTVSNASDELAHYNSVRDHRVVGTGPRTSELLVVRFYYDGHRTRAGLGL